MAKALTVIGIAVRLFLLVMAVWFVVSILVPTRDPLISDAITAVVLAVVAVIRPTRRLVLGSVMGRPGGGVRFSR